MSQLNVSICGYDAETVNSFIFLKLLDSYTPEVANGTIKLNWSIYLRLKEFNLNTDVLLRFTFHKTNKLVVSSFINYTSLKDLVLIHIGHCEILL